jgi:hypothetical protein
MLVTFLIRPILPFQFSFLKDILGNPIKILIEHSILIRQQAFINLNTKHVHKLIKLILLAIAKPEDFPERFLQNGVLQKAIALIIDVGLEEHFGGFLPYGVEMFQQHAAEQVVVLGVLDLVEVLLDVVGAQDPVRD